MKVFWKAWDKTLNLLNENDLLSHVVFVDFDQEFPYFSPFAPKIDSLGQIKPKENQGMEAAGKVENKFAGLKWNPAQMAYVRGYMDQTLSHFQWKYPELRFTFSLTSFWDEVRAMNLKKFDVPVRLVRGVYENFVAIRILGCYALELQPSLLEKLEKCGMVPKGKFSL